MKQIRLIMGMPITIEIPGSEDVKTKSDIEKVFDYFKSVDKKFSPFKDTSEVAKLNRGEKVSEEMKKILKM